VAERQRHRETWRALLVRPDGFVCWRAVKGPPTGQSADAVLLQVLSRVLSLLEQALDSV